MSKGKRMPAGRALELVQPLMDALGDGAMIAGSMRRGKGTVGDVDIVIPRRVGREEVEGLGEWVQGGERKIRLELGGEIQVDIVMCEPEEFGACLMYLTGPFQYNIEMRAEAKANGFKLNEKGLWRGDERVAGATEREIFAALGLKYCTPPGRTELKTFADDVAWSTTVIGSKGDEYEVSLRRDGTCSRGMTTEFYEGPSLEQGGTSIRGKGPAPYVRRLAKRLEPGTTILDYGAGRYARNADFLRGLGFTVYAYDPFNGNGTEGYEPGSVSTRLPRRKFDLGLTCYVLNVVPEPVEEEILARVARLSRGQVHVTRGLDIFDSVKGALERGDETVCDFFREHYMPGRRVGTAFRDGRLTEEQILDFCRFGVQTSRGFQRIPDLTAKGFVLEADTRGFRAFGNTDDARSVARA